MGAAVKEKTRDNPNKSSSVPCGLIEWVENVTTLKSCVLEHYKTTGTEWPGLSNHYVANMPFEYPPNHMHGNLMKCDAILFMKYYGLKGIKGNLLPDNEKTNST